MNESPMQEFQRRIPEFAAVRAAWERAWSLLTDEAMRSSVYVAGTIEPAWARLVDARPGGESPAHVASVKGSLAYLFKEQVRIVCRELRRIAGNGMTETGALDRIDSIRRWWVKNGVGTSARRIRDDMKYADELIEVARKVCAVAKKS